MSDSRIATRRRSIHLRDGWAVLTRAGGLSWASVSRTRAEAIKAHVKWIGMGNWKHRQKMGDLTIKIAIHGVFQ